MAVQGPVRGRLHGKLDLDMERAIARACAHARSLSAMARWWACRRSPPTGPGWAPAAMDIWTGRSLYARPTNIPAMRTISMWPADFLARHQAKIATSRDSVRLCRSAAGAGSWQRQSAANGCLAGGENHLNGIDTLEEFDPALYRKLTEKPHEESFIAIGEGEEMAGCRFHGLLPVCTPFFLFPIGAWPGYFQYRKHKFRSHGAAPVPPQPVSTTLVARAITADMTVTDDMLKNTARDEERLAAPWPHL